MLPTANADRRYDDIDNLLQGAGHEFHVNKWSSCSIIKSMLSVDTKVGGHGWRRRNFTNDGFALFDEFYNFCQPLKEFVQNNVPNIVFLCTACAQNGLALWRAGIDH